MIDTPDADSSDAAAAPPGGLEERLQQMASLRAFERVERAFRASGVGLIARLTGCQAPTSWRHYPDGELVDRTSGAQAFYHQHPAAERPAGEQGHLHLFVRPERLRAPPHPLALPPPPDEPGPGDAPPALLCHLAAIGLAADGRPCRVFSTNQWVTGEAWYATADVLDMLDRFTLDTSHSDPLVGDWLTAAVRLLKAPIVAVIRDRDRALGLPDTAPPGVPPPLSRLGDRAVEILAERPVPDGALPPRSL